MKYRKCIKCKKESAIEDFTRVSKGDNKVHTSVMCIQCYKDGFETLAAIRMYSEGSE